MDLFYLTRLLGKPYFQAANCLIYNLDCLQAMKSLSDECINLTLTSPPYNIGKEYEKSLPLDEYLEWGKNWISEIYRITSPQGAFWLNLGYCSIPDRAKAIPIPYLLWDKIPFYLIQEVVNQKKNGKIKVNLKGKNPTDVWQFPKVTSGQNRASKERTSHPAQFPIAVIERIIKACSNQNEIVLDPFIGSGTTAVVALGLQRPVIGFEIRKDYCDIAAKRIEKFLGR